jgi:D,D-heptose 1,7-bisphosphate phosphatase
LKNINFGEKFNLTKILAMINLKKTLFLDRDGTINREVSYLKSKNDFKLLPGVENALRNLTNCGWQLIGITNQSGVARGIISEDFLMELHREIIDDFSKHGINLRNIYYCPHHEEAVIPFYKKRCPCRKPEPGLILKAAKEYHADLKKSFFVGDKLSDVLAGKRAGLKTVLVLTGYGSQEKQRIKEKNIVPDYIFPDLPAFADWLTARNQNQIIDNTT